MQRLLLSFDQNGLSVGWRRRWEANLMVQQPGFFVVDRLLVMRPRAPNGPMPRKGKHIGKNVVSGPDCRHEPPTELVLPVGRANHYHPSKFGVHLRNPGSNGIGSSSMQEGGTPPSPRSK